MQQGDPISSLFFIAVMKRCFDELEQKRRKANLKREGLKFGLDFDSAKRNLPDPNVADDVVLFAQQRSNVEQMLRHL